LNDYRTRNLADVAVAVVISCGPGRRHHRRLVIRRWAVRASNVPLSHTAV